MIHSDLFVLPHHSTSLLTTDERDKLEKAKTFLGSQFYLFLKAGIQIKRIKFGLSLGIYTHVSPDVSIKLDMFDVTDGVNNPTYRK